jgi:hypothetical protein
MNMDQLEDLNRDGGKSMEAVYKISRVIGKVEEAF